MAWRAYISQPIGVTANGWLSAVVDYYDDADPTNAGVGLSGPGNGTATASTDLISITGHGLAAGNQVIFTALTGGAGLTLGVPYYVIATGLTANVFSVSTKPGGTAVDITSNATALTAFKVTPPVNVLWSKAWDLPPETTSTQLSAAAVAEGQKARAWLAARNAARAGVPVGTNVAVT
jgi:hypothetical protein